jgi:hypothetical protein
MNGLTEGRMVHYVMPDGKHRPAVVVKVWRVTGEGGIQDPPVSGCSNLQVFTDGPNDLPYTAEEKKSYENSSLSLEDVRKGMVWATSIMFSEEPKPHTWHWIEKA